MSALARIAIVTGDTAASRAVAGAAATLLTLYTGRKPSKRAMEALQLYWLGYASLDELCVALKIEKKANV